MEGYYDTYAGAIVGTVPATRRLRFPGYGWRAPGARRVGSSHHTASRANGYKVSGYRDRVVVTAVHTAMGLRLMICNASLRYWAR